MLKPFHDSGIVASNKLDEQFGTTLTANSFKARLRQYILNL